MSRVRLVVKGKPGAIPVQSFLTAIDSAFKVLADLEIAITHNSKRTLEWLVTDLSMGSLAMEALAQPKREDRNVGPEVSAEFVSGLRIIEKDGSSPPLLSETGMRTAQKMLRVIGKGGATGIEVSTLNDTATLTAEAVANIGQLIPERQRSLGAVEGKLETISVHGGRPKFTIYLSRTRKAVACRVLPEALFQQAKEALGRRVLVTGVVHSNARGEPLSVEANRIRVFRRADELPKTADLHGIDPQFAGGMTSGDYIRVLRDA